MPNKVWDEIDGLMQERHNSIANAQELRLSRTYPSKLLIHFQTSSVQLLGLGMDK